MNLKNKLLFAGIILLMLISYKLAIQKSVRVWQEYRSLEAQASFATDIPGQMAQLIQKENYYDSILKHREFSSSSFQNNLLKTLNEEVQKNGVQVIDFKQPKLHLQETETVQTYRFSLRGGFSGILKTLFYLEQKGSFGDIVHIGFKKEKHIRQRQENLEAVVLLQYQQ